MHVVHVAGTLNVCHCFECDRGYLLMVMGMQVFGRAYDIFTARNLEDFESKSWFDCMHGATSC